MKTTTTTTTAKTISIQWKCTIYSSMSIMWNEFVNEMSMPFDNDDDDDRIERKKKTETEIDKFKL